MNKISIIVPVYNTQDHLRKCIDSIREQSYENLEIIIVDDGSTDNSLNIMKELQALDNRIVVLTQENKGVSAARNYGLKVATGKFIQFVDSDDFLDPDCCLKMVSAIKEYDLCVCGMQEVEGNIVIKQKKMRTLKISNNQSMKSDIFECLKADLLHSPVNKLFRKELIDFFYQEDVPMGEDILFNMDYLEKCKSAIFLPECLYTYVRTSNSASRRFRKDMGDIQCKIYGRLYSFFSGLDEESICWIDEKFFEHMVQLVFKRAIVRRNIKKEDRLFSIKQGLDNELFRNLLHRYKVNTIKNAIWVLLIKTKLIYVVVI